jgi:two-component system, sensor histidine kinase and response regulator
VASAERVAHSLKGAAGTLGAMDLSEKAAETEAAVRTGRAVEEAIQSLSLSLAAVPEAIRAALPNETSGNGPASSPIILPL